MWFTSDNAGPAAPQIMEAVVRANQGYDMPYGNDEIMARVREQIRETFEAPEAEVHLVATGTAANSIALACLCPPWGTIYGHHHSHIEEDECGAPEFYSGGAKLTLIEGADARMDPAHLAEVIANTAALGVHNVQKGALSITNTTERGSVYSLAQVRELAGIAKEAGVPVHMDGARFANAVAAVGCTAAEMTWKSGVDILSFGGTKNGCVGVEAVVFFDPAKAWEFELRRKRGGHLFSKHRYLSAQMEAYLTDGLWLELAQRANRAAARLVAGIESVEGASMVHPCEANILFAQWRRAGHRAAQAAGARYYPMSERQSIEGPDDEPLGARLVCNWATSDEQVDRFVETIKD